MYLAAEGLQRTADTGGFRAPPDSDAKAAAHRYAYEWRHGMAGRWPFFVPGFFAVGIGTALWARGKTIHRIVGEGIAALSAATLIARFLARFGTRRLIRSFERDSGFECEREPLEPTLAGAATGGLTVASWTALVVAAQRSVIKKSAWPLLIPLALYAWLASLRRGDFGLLALPWIRRAVKGDSTAINSSVLAAVTAVGLWKHASCVGGAAAMRGEAPGRACLRASDERTGEPNSRAESAVPSMSTHTTRLCR
jgi:hypothetical protein